MSTLIILGNGFDLDLQIDTRYKTYIESNHFRNLEKNHNSIAFQCFLSFIYEEYQEIEKINKNFSNHELKWFDLETAIVKYYINNPHQNYTNDRNNDFPRFIKSINDFIIDKSKKLDSSHLQYLYNNQDLSSVKLIRLINKYQTSNHKYKIYNFNYTSEIILKETIIGLGDILSRDRCDFNVLPIFPVHGSIINFEQKVDKSENIVIGGTHDALKNTNANHVKKSDQNATSRGLFNANEIANYDSIVIFGHSLGNTDKHYFKQIFDCIENRPGINLYIYTKDGDSESEIKSNISNICNDYDFLNTQVNIRYNDIEFLKI